MIKSPVVKGEVLDIEVIGIGRKGDGIGKLDEFVVVIPFGILGNRYKVVITDIYEKFAFARIIGDV